MKPVAVIVNGNAGNGHDEQVLRSLRQKLGALGFAPAITLAGRGMQVIEATRAACNEGARLVVAGGGDGTVNAVASVLTESSVPLGVLPLGTLNHFARDLGIPLELDAAVRVLAHGKPRAVDVGEVNGRIFLNNSGLGLYPDMVHERQRQQRRLGRGKWPAALWAGLAALRRYPFLSIRLIVDGKKLARRTPFVFIGNNEYKMQGLAIGVRERLDAGKLCLYVAQRPGRLGLLRFALRALLGKLNEERDLDMLLADEMEIASLRSHLRVSTDGEVTTMKTPLCYRCRPGALTVIVPS
jgi:diacylglycerol kinase family enzyme